jgi:hypothetical protein
MCRLEWKGDSLVPSTLLERVMNVASAMLTPSP